MSADLLLSAVIDRRYSKGREAGKRFLTTDYTDEHE
jgi:hypothetical protein